MKDPKGYYEILGINNNSTKEEIKQAYRKMAFQWHPDRNPNNLEEADAKFKKISEAYTVLYDDNKKKLYDLGMLDNQNNNFNDIPSNFTDFFNTDNFFNMGVKEKNMIIDINIDLIDIFSGKTIEKEIEKKVLCNDCNGKGYIQQAIFNKCKYCNGNGKAVQLEEILPGMMRQINKKCHHCKGYGKTLDPKFFCKKCNGDKSVYKTIKKKIIIEKGLPDNSQLTYENEGYLSIETKKYGDLIINIKVNEHPNFKRIGNHLLYENEIDLIDSLCGYSFNVTKINGENITCSSNKILSPYNIQIVYNQGLPIYKTDNYGHLIIKSKIIFPKEIPEKRKEFLKKVLLQNEKSSDEKNNTFDCHILDEKQSIELINRINNKKNIRNDYYDNQRENIECVQM